MSPPTQLHDEYPSIRATTRLVGREETLAQIYQKIQESQQSTIIYITGRGGIGKTRLVDHVLKNISQKQPLRIASRLVDLYHTNTNTVEGLIEAILNVLSIQEGEFENYLRERETFREFIM